MPLHHDWVTDGFGNALSGATVTVYLAGTSTAASLFSDAALTVSKTNPLTVDASGFYSAHMRPGKYKFRIERAGFTTVEVDEVSVGTGGTEIDVREFGNLFTGGDVSAVIQAALDYADGLSQAAVMRMPAGYFIASNLQVPSLVHFRGQGRSTVIQAPDGATGFIIGTKNVSSERLHVSDFWLQGNMASATVTGVYFNNDGGTFTGAEPENKLTDMLIT